MNTKSVSVFIDSNIYLSFYGYTNHDLDQLEKIIDLITKKTITLYMTSQVKDEVTRNRDKLIATALADFKKSNVSTNLPLLINEYDPETKNYIDACKAFVSSKDKLIKRFLQDVSDNKLRANSLFDRIIQAKEIQFIQSDEFMEMAKLRKEKGNPPGKGGSLGDEINWETLLAKCPDSDLKILSNDGDFRSDLDKAIPASFLSLEWEDRKKSKLFLYESLGVFLNEVDHTIKLESETKKNTAVLNISFSTSFANTHNAIANAKPYIPLFGNSDLVMLAEAAKSNTQISQIHTDEDVKSFYYKIFHSQLDKIPSELRMDVVQKFFDDTGSKKT